jgi:hypothetical protein
VPAELCAVFTITLVADAFVEDGVELEEWCELELLPHAATTKATPTPKTLVAYNLILLRLTIVATTLSFRGPARTASREKRPRRRRDPSRQLHALIELTQPQPRLRPA